MFCTIKFSQSEQTLALKNVNKYLHRRYREFESLIAHSISIMLYCNLRKKLFNNADSEKKLKLKKATNFVINVYQFLSYKRKYFIPISPEFSNLNSLITSSAFTKPKFL